MRILIVDDNPTNLLILKQLTSRVDGCVPVAVSSAREALTLVAAEPVDIAVIDNMMPDMNGIQLIAALRALPNMADLPIVMVTSDEDRAVRHQALEAGATDYLTKPVDVLEFKIRLRNMKTMREARNTLAVRDEVLTQAVVVAREALAQQEEELIMRLSRALESRDSDTGEHVARIARVAAGIAEALGLDKARCREIYLAAPLHDIGKIAVPEHILRKPGPLDDAERLEMQKHTIHGHAILADSNLPIIKTAAEMALFHHEHYDGSGYPQKLSGAYIPLSARILAVADVYDALTHARTYKDAWSVPDACSYMVQNRGKQFDPQCVDALLKYVHQSLSGAPTSAAA